MKCFKSYIIIETIQDRRKTMLGYIEDVKIISSFKKASKLQAIVESRPSHAFIFRLSGEAEYSFDGKKVRLKKGDIAFLPKGAHYECRTWNSIYMSINFSANIGNPKIAFYSLDSFYGPNYEIESFAELWNFGGEEGKYKCLSMFYDLLSYISRLENMEKSEEKKYALIKPAIEYLKANIYSPTLRIDKLHSLCGISDTYLRRIFKERFRIAPQEYVLASRLTHAKSILDSGDFDSIKEVSELVGYTDPLYFSKAFKKLYGYSPSDIK